MFALPQSARCRGRARRIVLGLTLVIQAPKQGLRTMRYELTDNEWSAIKPMLPNKPRGVPRVNDRRVLNGIFWVLRSGAPWRDLPEAFGRYTTCYNRFVRWRRAGVWRGYLAFVQLASIRLWLRVNESAPQFSLNSPPL